MPSNDDKVEIAVPLQAGKYSEKPLQVKSLVTTMGFVSIMHIHAYLGMHYDARKYNLIQFSTVYCIALKMATKQKIRCDTIAYDTIKDSMVQYNAMKNEN